MPFNFPLYNFGNPNAMYQPDTKIFDMISGMLGNIPQRNNDQSILQRILAGVVGAGSGGSPVGIAGGQPIGFQFDANKGLLAQDKFMNPGYYSDLENYNNKLKILSPMLENEQQQNVNKRILFDQNEDRKIRQQGVERQEARDAQLKLEGDKKLQLAEQKAERDKKYNDARIAKMQQGYKFFTTEDGSIVAVNDSDPSKVINTGLNSGELNDLEKAQLDLQQDLKRYQAQHANRMSEIDAREENIRTRPVRAGAVGNENPTQTKIRIANIANQAKREHPDWNDWIVVDKANNVSIVEPTQPKGGIIGSIFGGNTKGPTQEVYDAINKYFETQPIKASSTTLVPNKGTNTNAPTNTGKIRVKRKSDGATGTIDAKDFDASKYDKIGG